MTGLCIVLCLSELEWFTHPTLTGPQSSVSVQNQFQEQGHKKYQEDTTYTFLLQAC